MSFRAAGVGLLLLLFSCFSASTAGAHSRPVSYSFWTLKSAGADVRVQIALDELAALGFDVPTGVADARDGGRALQRGLVLDRGGVVCPAAFDATRVESEQTWAVYRWSVDCPGKGPLRISARFASSLPAGHRHLVRFDDGAGHVDDRVLDARQPTWSVPEGPSSQYSRSSFSDFLVLGVEHLLTGWDHLAFVFALLLLASRLREVLGLVTAFTLSHSVTLAVSVLGVVRPNPAPVEALIAFSIALLGAENAWLLSDRPRTLPLVWAAGLVALLCAGGGSMSRLAVLGLLLFSCCHFALLDRAKEPEGQRIAIAFAFGLIHGFGFAGAMAEMDLPKIQLATALFGFNAGVELGQLTVVALLWPLLRVLRRTRDGRWSSPFAEAASAAVVGLGLFWFVVRNFG